VTSLSPALLLAWDIAANEAAHARQALIEPAHLFIGLCKLEDFTSVTALINLGYTQAEAETMQPDIEALITVFYQFGLSPTTLRRELRTRRGTGMLNMLSGWTTGMLRPSAQEKTESSVIHRSQASRLVFGRADELALMHGSFSTGVAHLLAALLEDAQSPAVVWLRKHQVDSDALRQAALESRPIARNP
jgi:ATP-dependent Clp protease ATP-binding subunit ClpA